MANSNEVNVTIGKDLVEPIVQARIQAAILEQLGGADALIPAIVNRALTLKVDREGKVNNYSSSNDQTYLEFTVGQMIRGAARNALEKWVADHQPKIEAALLKEMNRKSGILAKEFCASMLDCVKSSYKMSVAVNLQTHDREQRIA